MTTPEEFASQLSNDELKEAFLELKQWNATGLLKKDGVFEKVRNNYIKIRGLSVKDLPLHTFEKVLLLEIAERWVKMG